ncbi:ABC transporter I family member 11, chloroplastic [Vitis vinifera]|uniref:ABC transporter I family member 11, chloroplastic n=1 Tax=Vitis vinifera TaxID=29760 RepID=A0A438EBP4_VITVI|nr:ABC transporter I family member 11, chloroplastic [Vitis vinifera]
MEKGKGNDEGRRECGGWGKISRKNGGEIKERKKSKREKMGKKERMKECGGRVGSVAGDAGLRPRRLNTSAAAEVLVVKSQNCSSGQSSGEFEILESAANTLVSKGVSYRPQGTEFDLLNDVNFSLPEKSFGLIFGRSGSGKTTLLQLLAGINKPTSGSIFVQKYGDDGKLTQTSEPLPSERVGILFQFPERY